MASYTPEHLGETEPTRHEPDKPLRPMIDTLADAQRFTSGGEVPTYQELQSLGTYVQSFERTWLPYWLDSSAIFTRFDSTGRQEILSADDLELYHLLARPDAWLLTPAERTRQQHILFATELSEVFGRGYELLRGVADTEEDRQIALGRAQDSAHGRLVLDAEIRAARRAAFEQVIATAAVQPATSRLVRAPEATTLPVAIPEVSGEISGAPVGARRHRRPGSNTFTALASLTVSWRQGSQHRTKPGRHRAAEEPGTAR